MLGIRSNPLSLLSPLLQVYGEAYLLPWLQQCLDLLHVVADGLPQVLLPHVAEQRGGDEAVQPELLPATPGENTRAKVSLVNNLFHSILAGMWLRRLSRVGR